MTDISIHIAQRSDAAKWDQYIDASAESTFFHLFGWYNVISSALGHKPYYLWALDDVNNVKGVLPLFQVKCFLFGNSLVSLPFAVYGGAVAESAETRNALEHRAAKLAEELQVDYLELRNLERSQPDWHHKSIHSTFIRELHDNDEDNLKAIKNKQRAVVRKSIKADFTINYDNMDEFYFAYSTSVRNLGTPVFSKRFFHALKTEFSDQCEVLSVKNDANLHCALMSFYFKDSVLPYYAGGLPQSRTSKAMDFMYFDQMCRAGSKGLKYYDFGRSKNDTGPYNYKRHWGFTAKPLHYEYYLVKAKEMPELNPLNPKYQLLVKTWQKLPLPISQFFGPLISKYLG